MTEFKKGDILERSNSKIKYFKFCKIIETSHQYNYERYFVKKLIGNEPIDYQWIIHKQKDYYKIANPIIRILYD